MLDAITAANEWMHRAGLRRRAASRSGSSARPIRRSGSSSTANELEQPPNLATLQKVEFPYDVEFVGEGEIAHVGATADEGRAHARRSIRARGLVLDESYSQVSDVVRHQPHRLQARR